MDWSIVWTILYGAICGYAASRILGGEGFGFIGNIVIGILGGVIGRYFFQKLNIHIPPAALQNFIGSVTGAVILIIALEFFKSLWMKPSSGRRKR
ncbi:MAG: GlsB/YeaQ/YmgE family stress response membrane protein [Saprospiraceae bacterium]|nr:GlsB/YeaQ/YmgE family stress response membrane protein [Saprospiraceae bacterium]